MLFEADEADGGHVLRSQRTRTDLSSGLESLAVDCALTPVLNDHFEPQLG